MMNDDAEFSCQGDFLDLPGVQETKEEEGRGKCMPMSYHSEKERARNPILLITLSLSTQYIYTCTYKKHNRSPNCPFIKH